jgi:hypothetical protein
VDSEEKESASAGFTNYNVQPTTRGEFLPVLEEGSELRFVITDVTFTAIEI